MGATITEQAFELRASAEAGPVGKRKSSFELYAILGQCMALAERCKTGDEFDEMRRLVAQQPTANSRRYVEKGSDHYTLVCRFVFANLKSPGAEGSNASRYAHCMRQANKAGIKPEALADHLRTKGGINALFLRRPLEAATVTTKCLALATVITVIKGEPFTLRLRRLPDNTYEVLS